MKQQNSVFLQEAIPYFDEKMAELDKLRSTLPYRETRVIEFPDWYRYAGFTSDYPDAVIHNFERYLDRMMNLSFDFKEGRIYLHSADTASYAFLDTISFIDDEELNEFAAEKSCFFGYYGNPNDDQNIRDEVLLSWHFFLGMTLRKYNVMEEEPDDFENYQLRLVPNRVMMEILPSAAEA